MVRAEKCVIAIRVAALLLIAAGVWALLFGSISTVGAPAWAGVSAIVIGGALLLVASNRR